MSIDSKRAIGVLEDDDAYNLNVHAPLIGTPADFVLLYKNQRIESAVLEPSFDRTTVKAGRVVARRVARYWVASDSEDD